MNKYRGAGVIIYNSNIDSLVIVKGNQNIYSFPKGHIKNNETLEECASRELNEETGVYISPEKIAQCNKIIIYEYVYFIMNVTEEFKFKIIDVKEIIDCKWTKISEILSFLHYCNQGIKKIITNWNFYKAIICNNI